MTQGLTLGVVHSVGLDKGIMMCIHDCGIIQDSFTALKVLSNLPVHPSMPQSLVSTDLFTVSVTSFNICVNVGLKEPEFPLSNRVETCKCAVFWRRVS